MDALPTNGNESYLSSGFITIDEVGSTILEETHNEGAHVQTQKNERNTPTHTPELVIVDEVSDDSDGSDILVIAEQFEPTSISQNNNRKHSSKTPPIADIELVVIDEFRSSQTSNTQTEIKGSNVADLVSTRSIHNSEPMHELAPTKTEDNVGQTAEQAVLETEATKVGAVKVDDKHVPSNSKATDMRIVLPSESKGCTISLDTNGTFKESGAKKISESDSGCPAIETKETLPELSASTSVKGKEDLDVNSSVALKRASVESSGTHSHPGSCLLTTLNESK